MGSSVNRFGQGGYAPLEPPQEARIQEANLFWPRGTRSRRFRSRTCRGWRRGGLPRTADPGAAAKNAPPTLPAGPGRPIRRRSIVVTMPAVFDPFPGISQYVVQSKAVRCKRPNRCGIGVAIFAQEDDVRCLFPVECPGSRVIRYVCRLARPLLPVAPPPRRHCASSRHILPFRFRQQAIGLPCLGAQPTDIRSCIIPVDTNHRVPIVLRVAWAQPAFGGVQLPLLAIPGVAAPAHLAPRLAHEGRKLAPGHLILPHRQGVANRHPVLRAFVIVASRLRPRRAHGEAVRRNLDHVGALRALRPVGAVIPKLRPRLGINANDLLYRRLRRRRG